MADALVNGCQKVIAFKKIPVFPARSQEGFRPTIRLDNIPLPIGDGYAGGE
jgi:hypothetical protein